MIIRIGSDVSVNVRSLLPREGKITDISLALTTDDPLRRGLFGRRVSLEEFVFSFKKFEKPIFLLKTHRFSYSF